MSEFEKLVSPYYEEALKTLEEVIAINSVDDPLTSTEEHPFGDGVEKALSYIAKLGKKLGFNVDRCDNYATELSLGEGECLDIYAHLDVVPVSSNWKTDPFKLVIDGDKMFGRGTIDDKGPGIAVLYAIKALYDNNKLDKNFKLRLIYGGNEEKGSRCLEHYFNVLNKQYPKYGFTPDSDFPLIYAEKSVSSYTAKYNIPLNGVKDFSFGVATNIVLGEVEVDIYTDPDMTIKALNKYLKKYSKKTGIKASYNDHKLKFSGKPAHGSLPHLGVNAGLHLLNFLGYLYHDKRLKKIYKDYCVGDGVNFKGNYSSETFSSTSYCIGIMRYIEGTLSFEVNLRCPENVKVEDVVNNVRLKTGATEVILNGVGEPLYVDPNSYLIKTLLNVYQEESGDTESKILAIGGGTYSKESKNTVAFGAVFPGEDFKMHDDDEFWLISRFKQCMSIYAHAIYNLSLGMKDDK